jgi:phosphonate transport system substrate-binding protein
LKLLFAVLFFFASVVFAEGTPNSITVGFTPSGDPQVLRSGALEIAKALQEELHIPVNVYISKNYTGLVEAMKTKKVDFAFLTAMSYVFAEKEAGAKVLLKQVWEQPFYYSVILTKKNSKLKTLDNLNGKRIAFVDEKSTSGYLYPQVQMKKRKIIPSEKKFSGSHTQSVAWLDQSEVDAIAVFANDKKGQSNAYLKYSKEKNPEKKVQILWVSEPIPNDPFSVRQDFYDQYPKTTHNLMFALIDVVDKLKSNKDVKETIGAQGFIPATQKQYDSVREVVRELDLHP